MTKGKKHVPKDLKEKGVGIVAVNYRLYPKVKAPEYVRDGAAAVDEVRCHDVRVLVPFQHSQVQHIRSGISHSPREFSSPDDVVAGINVLLHTLLAVDRMELG